MVLVLLLPRSHHDTRKLPGSSLERPRVAADRKRTHQEIKALQMERDLEIRKLWELDGDGIKPEIRQAASKLFGWLEKRDDDLSKLLTDRSDKKPKRDSVRDLEHDVIDRFKPLRETVHYLRALALVIERGNGQGLFDLCPPRIPVLIKRQPSPFLEGRMSLLARARLWREAISGSARVSHASTGDVYTGRILASAAVNGGLLHPSLL